MAQYRKKPVVVEACQWFKNGDHPDDYADRGQPAMQESEGMVVRYFCLPGSRVKACRESWRHGS